MGSWTIGRGEGDAILGTGVLATWVVFVGVGVLGCGYGGFYILFHCDSYTQYHLPMGIKFFALGASSPTKRKDDGSYAVGLQV